MQPDVMNVLNVYLSASDQAFADGSDWYARAHDEARSLDKRFHRSAGVIAALSPMNEWENNKRMAQRFYALDGNIVFGPNNENGLGLSNNVRKAMRIYRGEDALDVFRTSPKVRSFYLSIVDPRADIDPVIDRHAFDIAVGMRTDDKARSALSRKDIYRSFVDTYRLAADYAGIPPKEMQAITWVSWKERHGIK